MSETNDLSASSAFRDRLIEAGILVPSGVKGVYGKGPRIDSRGMPHLPSTVKVDDLETGVGSVDAIIVLWHRKTTTTPIWADSAGRDAVVSKTGDTLDASGR